jgi:hypothetical protein
LIDKKLQLKNDKRKAKNNYKNENQSSYKNEIIRDKIEKKIQNKMYIAIKSLRTKFDIISK